MSFCSDLPLENVTLLHFAEHVARLPGKRVIRYREKLLRNGTTERSDLPAVLDTLTDDVEWTRHRRSARRVRVSSGGGLSR